MISPEQKNAFRVLYLEANKKNHHLHSIYSSIHIITQEYEFSLQLSIISKGISMTENFYQIIKLAMNISNNKSRLLNIP